MSEKKKMYTMYTEEELKQAGDKEWSRGHKQGIIVGFFMGMGIGLTLMAMALFLIC